MIFLKKSFLTKYLILLLGFSFITYAQVNLIEKDRSLKVLVVTGGPTLRHQLDLVPTSFYELLNNQDVFIWDHATQDEAAFKSDRLHEYDVLIMYNRNDSLTKSSRENLRNYLNSGKGLLVIHHALGSYNDWEWWWKKVVGGKYQMVSNDTFKNSDFTLEQDIPMIPRGAHFINEQLGDFTFTDETYKNLWISNEVDVIYTTNNPSSDGPTVWISPFKQSKVVVIQPGHSSGAHLNKSYQELIFNAIKWVSK